MCMSLSSVHTPGHLIDNTYLLSRYTKKDDEKDELQENDSEYSDFLGALGSSTQDSNGLSAGNSRYTSK